MINPKVNEHRSQQCFFFLSSYACDNDRHTQLRMIYFYLLVAIFSTRQPSSFLLISSLELGTCLTLIITESRRFSKRDLFSSTTQIVSDAKDPRRCLPFATPDVAANTFGIVIKIDVAA